MEKLKEKLSQCSDQDDMLTEKCCNDCLSLRRTKLCTCILLVNLYFNNEANTQSDF